MRRVKGRYPVRQVVVDARLIMELTAMASLADANHRQRIGEATRKWHSLPDYEYPDPVFNSATSFAVQEVLDRYGVTAVLPTLEEALFSRVSSPVLPAEVYRPLPL